MPAVPTLTKLSQYPNWSQRLKVARTRKSCILVGMIAYCHCPKDGSRSLGDTRISAASLSLDFGSKNSNLTSFSDLLYSPRVWCSCDICTYVLILGCFLSSL